MDAVYGTLVQIMLKLCILPGGKPFGLFENYHSGYLKITIQNTLQHFAWYK